MVAPYLYQGQIKDLLWRYKFGHGRAAAELMAREVMIQLTANYDLVTFVPTAGRRRRQRGYDQAQLLAKAVARRLGRPCRPLLKRQGQARQVGATRKQRLIQAQKSYSYAGPDLTDQQVLLVDDVISTGATVTACADLLLANGAAQVDIAAFAIKS